MPVADYGVWKATATRYTYETDEQDSKSPHLSLYFSDDNPGEGRAAINIKSGDSSDSRLAFWTVPDFRHPITQKLAALSNGFKGLAGADQARPDSLALDYIRSNLFARQSGRILPHDIPGEKNDIIDVLKPIIDRTIEQNAHIYLYGSSFKDGKGIHNNHMNQGSPQRWARDNGVYHDGGLIIEFEDHWEGVFIGFASQAVHTKDDQPKAGSPIPPTGYMTWADFLDPETDNDSHDTNEQTDSPVLITEALVNPKGPDRQPGVAPETVTLRNRTDKDVDLTGWRVRNIVNQFQNLPDGAVLPAGGTERFEVPNCPLSNQGGTITLLNAQGLKVHGVSYTNAQAHAEGISISFK